MDLRSLILLLAVGACPVGSHRAWLRVLKVSSWLLQGRQAAEESILLLASLSWLRVRAWTLSWGRWGRHLYIRLPCLKLVMSLEGLYAAGDNLIALPSIRLRASNAVLIAHPSLGP